LATNIRTATTDELTAAEVAAIRALLFTAFEGDEHGGFTEDDWQHSVGGMHFIAESDDRIVGHASVVDREIHVDGRQLRTGYVEVVATDPSQQRRGIGTALIRRVNEHIAAQFELGVLGSGSQPFYERLGWLIWPGPSFVRTEQGDERTADEDGYILVLLTPITPELDLEAPISCEWRPGDVW
jgi:aminoglycoside 2'-N-acetyltransferase I